MDAVCIKGRWSAVWLKDQNGNLEGLLVYHIRSYLGFRFILMPMMTAYNGVYLIYPEGAKQHTRISFENRVIPALYEALPKHDFYYQQHYPAFNNWLPLKWKGYKQSTRYTFLIDLDKSTDELWNNMKSNVRTNIRKTEEHCSLEKGTIDLYWKHLVESCNKRQKKNLYNQEVLNNVYNALSPSGKCRIVFVKHKDSGEILGGIFLVNDKNTSYYVSGFYYPDKNPKYAFTYLIWEMLKSSTTHQFDFEGSIIPEIETFFRNFGGDMVPHFKIWKTNSFLLSCLLKFKKLDFID